MTIQSTRLMLRRDLLALVKILSTVFFCDILDFKYAKILLSNARSQWKHE